MAEKYLEAGKVVNTHGVRGEVKIQPWADSPDFLTKFEYINIGGKDIHVLSSRVHKDCVIALLEGVEDINSAMCLRNKIVYIDREQAQLPEGSFFLQDIYGIRVFDESGTELGTVTDVLVLPANNVYVVSGKREYLIPAVSDFVLKVDLADTRMVVRLIEGM